MEEGTHTMELILTLKMDYNENSHIKLTVEPCLCCVQVTIYCCGHVFLFIIFLQFDRQNETPLLRFLNFPPCTGSRQRPIENPLWNPRYSTSGLVNQRKGMTYNPWTTESKQKTPCYFRVYYTCIFMRQQRHEVNAIQYTRSFMGATSHTKYELFHELRAFGETWLFWVVERRSNWKMFCMKEQVLLNTNNMLVIITHFLNENSNTATYHYSVVVHL